MFGETTISYVKIGNHPIETTIYKWLLGVPGIHTAYIGVEDTSIDGTVRNVWWVFEEFFFE